MPRITPARSQSVLGANIWKARNALALRQRDVAEAAELQTAVYGRIERGEVDPRLSTIVKIAQALETTVVALTARTDGR